jgi:Zn-dependent metalloprotease
MLQAIAANGTAEERRYARATLAQDAAFRTERRLQQPSGGGQPGADAGAGAGSPHKNRRVFTASNGTSLPGTSRRDEGQAATGDAAVDQCYDGLGGTFDLFWDIFGRDSIDGNGMDLIGTVHYGNKYNNAFWNGSQMVFGDGDGLIFNSFTADPDVMGHELAHGVTGATAGLEYHDQPGALNESVSDCFGSMVKQRMLGQSSAQADWLIGAHLLASGINGVALRSMKAPGTAYDDSKLGGKDPQPDHMSKYVNTSSDNGGVHINSGIPNKAFYLLATALGGNSWDRAGPIWYRTLTASGLSATAQFAEFAKLTYDSANALYGSSVADVVAKAWQDVGIDLAITTWYTNRSVLSTFTSAHSMNAWAYIDGLGWRKVEPRTPDGVTNMFDLLTEVQASGRAATVYADGSLIYQAYSV